MNQTHRRTPGTIRCRSAFTLLEVLIALTLVTTLMALAWSLLATFSRLESRGRRTVEGLEITRSLRRQLEDDLDQLVQFQIKPPGGQRSPSLGDNLDSLFSGLNEQAESGSGSNSRSGSSSSGSSSSSAGTEFGEFTELSQPAEITAAEMLTQDVDSGSDREYLKRSLFEGSSQSLSFLIGGDPFSQPAAFPDRWRVVTYEWQTSGTADDPLATGTLAVESERPNEDPVVEEVFEEEPPVAGLGGPTNAVSRRVFVRRVRSIAAYQRESSQASTFGLNALLEGMETIEIGRTRTEEQPTASEPAERVDRLPEVSEISFRYFDGRSWKSSWSSSEESIPVAVEVVFRIGNENRSVTSEEASLESELDFESEIEIGGRLQETDDDPWGNANDPLMDLNPDFDEDSVRLLIRVGTRKGETRTETTETGSGDFEAFSDFEVFSDFEGGNQP